MNRFHRIAEHYPEDARLLAIAFSTISFRLNDIYSVFHVLRALNMTEGKDLSGYLMGRHFRDLLTPHCWSKETLIHLSDEAETFLQGTDPEI